MKVTRFVTICAAILFFIILQPAANPGQHQTSVLVDASKDGGVWWYPQAGPFDPALPHQGQDLADYMRAKGFVVNELPRPYTITCDLLSQYDLVIAIQWGGAQYQDSELSAYRSFVTKGGRVILLGDWRDETSPADNLAQHFGLELFGKYTEKVESFTAHPITAGVTSLQFIAGSVVTSAPGDATFLGFIGTHPALGIMPLGAGEIFFMGDTNVIEGPPIPQPFVSNLLTFMLDGAERIDVCNQAPDISKAFASPGCLWPANGKFVDVAVGGITDPDGDPVEIVVTGITSDEPTSADSGSHGPGSAPDASGLGGSVAHLRAERAGKGNGRVYEISFVANDGRGGLMPGSVRVVVPHDASARCSAIDDGQNYDATKIN